MQVEGLPTAEAVKRLARGGIDLKGHLTLPCQARLLDPAPVFPPRDPPVRFRKSVPDCWIELV